MKSSRHSGNSVHCPRSASSTKRPMNVSQESPENHNSGTAFSHSQGQNRKSASARLTSTVPLKADIDCAVGTSVLCHKRTHAPHKRQPYSITSSARVSSVGGTMTPSAFAVFKLITSSYLVGCSTGRSAGFAPLKILSTKPVDRRKRSQIPAP